MKVVEKLELIGGEAGRLNLKFEGSFRDQEIDGDEVSDLDMNLAGVPLYNDVFRNVLFGEVDVVLFSQIQDVLD